MPVNGKPGRNKPTSFAVTMIWREKTDHGTDCYFCLVPPIVNRLSKKEKWTVQYPNIQSVLCPFPHNEDIQVPEATGIVQNWVK